MTAETYLLPMMPEADWWAWLFWHLFEGPGVSGIYTLVVGLYLLWQMVSAYLTAFHRKSGHRLMADGEKDELRWRWPEEDQK